MADLVAIVYPDQYRAAEVLTALRRLQARHLLDLEDACVVVREPETGELRLDQATNLATVGAISGSFWGLLIGLLFLQPVIGAAVGAAAGAVTGRLSDYGINDEFMRNVSETLQPGSSAIFMLIRKATREEVEPELARFGGHVLYTNLPSGAEARLEGLLTASEPDPAPTRS